MRTATLAVILVFILTACIPSMETPTILPLDAAVETASAATAAVGGGGSQATVPPNYNIPIGSTVVLVCLGCEIPINNNLMLWQTPDEEMSVGDVPNNTQAVILENINRADGKPFYKVKTDKFEGWIAKDMVFLLDDTTKALIAATQAAHPQPGTAATLVCDTCSDLNTMVTLWETPEELTVISELAIGSEVTILEELTNAAGKSFYKVRAGDKEGWIVKDMVKPK